MKSVPYDVTVPPYTYMYMYVIQTNWKAIPSLILNANSQPDPVVKPCYRHSKLYCQSSNYPRLQQIRLEHSEIIIWTFYICRLRSDFYISAVMGHTILLQTCTCTCTWNVQHWYKLVTFCTDRCVTFTVFLKTKAILTKLFLRMIDTHTNFIQSRFYTN